MVLEEASIGVRPATARDPLKGSDRGRAHVLRPMEGLEDKQSRSGCGWGLMGVRTTYLIALGEGRGGRRERSVLFFA